MLSLRSDENFRFPVGHPRRHRLEILFSPGAAFSPFTGEPRTPRVAVPVPPVEPPVHIGSSRFDAADPPAALRDKSFSYDDTGDGAASIAPGGSVRSCLGSVHDSAIAPGGAAFAAPRSSKPASAVFSGPSQATPGDLAAHTLPVHSLLPLTMSLTLQEFEDVVSEAIYYGSQVAGKQKEQHPKEEARARAAAAIARARGEGY